MKGATTRVRIGRPLPPRVNAVSTSSEGTNLTASMIIKVLKKKVPMKINKILGNSSRPK